MNKLNFGLGNAKLAKSIATFSLPAGYSCPFAKDCLSMADRITGKIIDGQHCQYRCFSASSECTYPGVRKSRWENFDILKSTNSIGELGKVIQFSIPQNIAFVRIHVSGDFFTEKYFLAWLNVALNNPQVVFYGYTKAIPFLVKYKKNIPPNFRFTASLGGTCDNLIVKHKLRSAEVVFSVKEAEDKGLEIDHDDSHAYSIGREKFALLLHGTQPPKSEASRAWRALIKQGIGGYGDATRRKPAIVEKDFVVYVDIKSKGFNIDPKYRKHFAETNFGKNIYA